MSSSSSHAAAFCFKLNWPPSTRLPESLRSPTPAARAPFPTVPLFARLRPLANCLAAAHAGGESYRRAFHGASPFAGFCFYRRLLFLSPCPSPPFVPSVAFVRLLYSTLSHHSVSFQTGFMPLLASFPCRARPLLKCCPCQTRVCRQCPAPPRFLPCLRTLCPPLDASFLFFPSFSLHRKCLGATAALLPDAIVLR